MGKMKDKAMKDQQAADVLAQEAVPEGHKEYTVLTDGAIINGELLNHGDVVVLHPDVARAHTDADVRLCEYKEEPDAEQVKAA